MQPLDNATTSPHTNACPPSSIPLWSAHLEPPRPSAGRLILSSTGDRLMLRSDAAGGEDGLVLDFDPASVLAHALRLSEGGSVARIGGHDLLAPGDRIALSTAAREALAEFPLFLRAPGLPDPDAPAGFDARARDIVHRAIARLLLVFAGEDACRIERRDPQVDVDRACGHMIEHMGEALALADVVRATGASARTLQYSFSAALGMSPMRWLREQRLRRLHATLLAAPDDLGVTELAVAAGFTHLGRVGHLFEERFGMLPSRLLRRARRG